jgi:hypothetical protein
MSTSGHGSSHPSSLDDDGIDIKKILMIGGLSLSIFAISAVIAYFMLRSHVTDYEAKGLPAVPAMVGKDEIGIVDQPVFSTDRRLEEWKAAKQHRLGSYGWVDRKKNLIHIPMDKAIDQVVTESAANGNPQ